MERVEIEATDGGYWNRVLIVDLEHETQHVQVSDRKVRNLLLGGSGLGAWLWEHHSVRDAGALEPGNALVFAAGPLTGAGALQGTLRGLTRMSWMSIMTSGAGTGSVFRRSKR
ncbi:MAG: aldehyde ferredoxin oxidoreductase N-terminal domain-containing protein [Candidatus Cryosericum sp.]